MMRRGMLMALVVLACGAVMAQLRPAAVLQDNMVLQQGMPAPVWGTAAPGAGVTVQFAGQTVNATAGMDGAWKATLASLKASADPAVLTLTSGTQTVTLKNILVGEVWVCSGQSNMQFTVKDTLNANTEMAAANIPTIRSLNGPQGRWTVCTPATVGDFTAVGFFFARDINTRLHVPVGIINSSIGGTPIQAWMTPASAQALPGLKDYWTSVAKQIADYHADPAAYGQRVKAERDGQNKATDAWEQQMLDSDPGTKHRWFDPAVSTAGWLSVNLPMSTDQGLNVLGTVWFRRTVDIPLAWVGKPLILHLGPMDDTDVTYANATQVGRTGRDVKDFWRVPRTYTVPAVVNTSTHFTVALCIDNVYGVMGHFGTPEMMSVAPADDPAAPPVSLVGTWQVKIGAEVDVAGMPHAILPDIPTPDGGFGWLYKPCIAPLIPYAIKGVLWYQGENNAPEPDLYTQLAPAMVSGWRQAWGEGNFAFYFVQLAGYQGRQRWPVESHSWAEIREAQAAALTLPHTGMAVATDVGDAGDIHPRDKQDVGHRLALIAEYHDYGQKVEFCGPTVAGVKIKGAQLVVKFAHAAGLHLEGNAQTGFALAGADKVFHPATVVVKGNTVTVTAADGQVPHPVAVRYGWAYFPACYLYNADHLPASQFRTDTWPRDEVKSSI